MIYKGLGSVLVTRSVKHIQEGIKLFSFPMLQLALSTSI
mgnify:CR=1 FL=1